MATEKFVNNYQSTITGNMLAGDTTLTVNSAVGAPASPQFRVLVDSELMLVTAGGSGTTTWTVTRGAEGTTAAAHTAGATISQVFTSGGKLQFAADSVGSDTYANLPAAERAGRLYLPTDGFHVFRDTGAAWVPWGPLYPMVLPIDANYSWVNQGTAAVTATRGRIVLHDVATGVAAGLRARVKAAPGTPYHVVACFQPNLPPGSLVSVGLCFRDSASGKLVTMRYAWRSAGAGANQSQGIYYAVSQWSSATAIVADLGSFPLVASIVGPVIWFRIGDDGTNRTYDISCNGVDWVQIYTELRTTYITANQVGFYVDAENANYEVSMTLLSWQETS